MWIWILAINKGMLFMGRVAGGGQDGGGARVPGFVANCLASTDPERLCSSCSAPRVEADAGYSFTTACSSPFFL